MTSTLTESETEQVALDFLSELGYKYAYGPDLAPKPAGNGERANYYSVVLVQRLADAVERLNPGIPAEARTEAVKKVLRQGSQSLIANNHAFHRLLVDGVDVEYRKGQEIRYEKVRLFDFEHPDSRNNEFLAVNQFTVQAKQPPNRRPDIVLFVNGIPLVVIELKNPADEKATTYSAFKQLQTYKAEVPYLFDYNAFLIASDGLDARAGTITSDWERFMPWKTVDGKAKAPKTEPQMEVLFRGMLNKEVLLDLVRHFIVFEKEGGKISKKLAAYHQYHAVNRAVEATVRASSPKGDRRCGVVWHTQGSGKSLSMVFYTGKLVLALDNPTIMVLTDRNDLDGQLFDTFGRNKEVLRQTPIQAETRKMLRELLKVSSGGVVFTTIQKFLPEQKGDAFPLLSERRNIIVIADEAHRSQYDFIDGFARHMRDALPNAAFIGFTGTPIEKSDRSTPAVFGNYIDVYDFEQAVEDGATVRIFYESRLAELELKSGEKPKIDVEFEEVTEGEEVSHKEKLKSKWARLEAIVGSEKRLKRVAKDIVDHFEKRLEVMDGKGMIVCMSRRICVDLYKEIAKLRPEWANENDEKGFIKVVMTGSASDPAGWQEHIRNKDRRRAIGDNFKDPGSPIKLVIVRDMWLTGFDVPSLHSMYLDKPMRGHGLMQAIARVNRVFKDKPGGLVVDYLGIADELRLALSEYTQSGGKGKPAFDQNEAIAVMQEKYEIVLGLLHGFEFKRFFKASAREKMGIILEAESFILNQKEGKERFIKYVTALSQGFALAVPSEEALKIRDDLAFFQAVRARLSKFTETEGKPKEEIESAIRQIVSKAIVSDKVIDVFEAAGLKKPDISILSDEFLAEIKGMKHRNLALELLQKLLNDEIRARSSRNIVQAKSFSALLEEAIKRYKNRAIDSAKLLEELIDMAKEMREAQKRGEKLDLSEDELAFYDALADNDTAVKALGDETLRKIARELTIVVKNNTSIDWSIRESVRSKLKVLVKRMLKRYGYPPDKQESATELVLKQAEQISQNWVEN